LYRKVRGPRRLTVLTDAGRRFLPHALAFLERAHELCRAFEIETGQQEIRVAASQYLIRYVLIDVLKRFAKEEPAIHVRVSTMNEREVEEALLADPEVAFGLAAPYEPSPDLEYHELFAMDWSLIVPPGHRVGRSVPLVRARRRGRVAEQRPVTLDELIDEPLIIYERGSTGRQHVLDGVWKCGRWMGRSGRFTPACFGGGGNSCRARPAGFWISRVHASRQPRLAEARGVLQNDLAIALTPRRPHLR
jgi:DNA-binding transcriptional LysR family regulator